MYYTCTWTDILIIIQVISPTLTAVVHNFISERNSSEVIVVG